MTRGFKTLEKKYGVKVVSEGYHYSIYRGKMVETFKMYSADGCCWEKGMSRGRVKAECEEWARHLFEVKAIVAAEAKRRGCAYVQTV